jgi:hypothetical protein
LQQQEGVTAKGFAISSSSSSKVQQVDIDHAGSSIGNSESLFEQDRKWRLEPSAVGEWEVSSANDDMCFRRSTFNRWIAL